jgi:hypothetical protein
MAETGKKSFAARRSGGPRALAESLSKVTREALGKRGPAEGGLIVNWPEVVGAETAAICHPLKLSFARRDRRMDGTLTVRVRPGQATRLQHLEPRLVERINGYFGYRAVARLQIRQGPLGAANSAPLRAADDEAAPEPVRKSGSDRDPDPALAAALARLGRAIKLTNE